MADTWTIANTHCDARTLGRWNSVATISNGYLGLRGNLLEQRDGECPVTLINGVYDELNMFSLIRASNEERCYLDPRYFDSAGKSPAVANLPDPLYTQVFVGEREISLGRGELRNFRQVLDLRTGLHRYSYDFRDGAGHTTRIEMERFAPLRHAHRVYLRYRITPLDHAAPLHVHAGINGAVHSNVTGERQFQVVQHWSDPPQRCRLFALLPARGHEVRLGVLNRTVNGTTVRAAGTAQHDAVYTRFEAAPRKGAPLTLERCVVLTSSEDLRHRAVADLEAELDAAAELGFDAALAEQAAAWHELWQRCDVQIDGDDRAQLYLRFCIFHLLAAAPRFSDRLSVPAQLLSGEYYQGSTCYDADLCVVPFYAFTVPELARTCLDFRYEGLRPAREIARDLGHDGAKFAWQAGPYGEESLGRWWRYTYTSIHVNAAVVYALLQYVTATADKRYLLERGVDLLVETARFYAARATPDTTHERFELCDVTGPDEAHCASVNNFYTNYFAARNLCWAADALVYVEQADPQMYAAAARRLALKSGEALRWRHVADRLIPPVDEERKLYEQCEGFFQLKPLPADLLDERKTRWVTVGPYQALSQPDVLMALALFRADFPPDVHLANWSYYREKSLDLAPMGPAVHALLGAYLGETEVAYRDFVRSAGASIDESLAKDKGAASGLAGAALGGAWLAAVFGFGGVAHDAGFPAGAATQMADTHGASRPQARLQITPHLPAAWTGLRFQLMLQGVRVRVAITPEQIEVEVGRERRLALPASIAGQAVVLRTGERCVVDRRDGKAGR